MWASADSNHDGHFGEDDIDTIFNDYDDNRKHINFGIQLCVYHDTIQ